MRRRVRSHPALPAQGFGRCQEPRLEFAMRDDHCAWNVPRGGSGPALQLGRQIPWAILISIEEYKDGTTASLHASQTDGVTEPRLANQL